MEEGSFDTSAFNVGEYKSPQAKKTRSPKRFIILIAGVVVLGILVFGGNKILSSKSQKPQEVKITPTPTEYQFPTDTPTPSVLPTPEVSLTPTTKPKPNPVDKSTGLDRGKLNVSIQNGSGTVGIANKASDILKGLGYHVVSIGNADNFNYENVTLMVKPSASKYLSLLEKDLLDQYKIGSTSADLSASSSADAIVIIGK
ncbi:MAG: LytR C-terminal domain-containing protein [Candidatus Levybacteria bacterium]|nr:LytR C-terminal domain-containing protein [Candidatus Levybacteria bacterium]